MLAYEAGLSRRHLESGTRLGLLARELPSVYRVSASPRTRMQEVAAVSLWAAGGESAISHWTAAELHELDLPLPPHVHITTTRFVESPSPSIVVHPRAFLRDFDVCTIRGLAVTEPKRTLIDLAGVSRPGLWESALDAFLRRGMSIDEFVERFESTARQGRTGTRLIRRVLESRAFETGIPEQHFERKLFNLLRDFGLPLPAAQHPVVLPDGTRYRLDFAYPDAMVAIEAQSYGYHSDRQSWERDRIRLSELSALGWRVIEVTWRQLTHEAERVALRVQRALHPSHTPPGRA